MKKLLHIAIISLLINNAYSIGQPDNQRFTAQDYINKYKDDAIRDMLKTGVPASITLAQGMFESDYGNSILAKEARNHFGIKCHNEWTGQTYTQDDETKDECFRKYKSVQESYDDHSDFLRTRDRYKFLFDLQITDYKGWAYGLKKAGYATNPEYPTRLIKIIEENNLSELDKQGSKLIGKEFGNTSTKQKPTDTENKDTKKIVSTPLVKNEIPYTNAKKGDTWYKLSKDNNMELARILKYNDAQPDDKLHEGEIVYLHTKHNRADVDFYVAKKGDTMRYISQIYGVKLKKLYRRNHMEHGSQPIAGDQIKLR